MALTATVRKAETQIPALFSRAVEIFPPPGPDRRDSFFAKTLPSSQSNARLYVGITAQGRSLKVAMLRTYLALLGTGQKLYPQLQPMRFRVELQDFFNSFHLRLSPKSIG